MIAFRVLSLRKLRYTDTSWKAFANVLLKQAKKTKLSYGQELFLLNLERVDVTSVPKSMLEYKSMLGAWQVVTVRHDASVCSLPLVLKERIFLNSIFEEVCSDHSFMQCIIDAGLMKVEHFRDDSSHG